MKLNLTVLSETHKNILRVQRKFVISALDAIAAYLVKNGDVGTELREMLNKEYMINYYDVIPDKGPLIAHEIELELLVTNENGEVEIKVFRKDFRKANEALICIVSSKLKGRKARLLDMLKDATGEQIKLINTHITQTENLIKECYYLKLRSQLLIAEVGGLHFIDDILKQVSKNIKSDAHANYILFKKELQTLKELVQLNSPVREQRDYIFPYDTQDILAQRREFNKVFNNCKLLLSSLLQEGLLESTHENSIIMSFKHLQHLFFEKCDVNFIALR
ncbi:TPA: hypothetical protein ACT9M5_002813 [Legionella pneumophila]